jgi:hypothetical protein
MLGKYGEVYLVDVKSLLDPIFQEVEGLGVLLWAHILCPLMDRLTVWSEVG